MTPPRPETGLHEAIAAHALVAGLTGLSARAAHDLVAPLNRSASLLTLFVKRYQSRLDPEADKLLGLLAIAAVSMEGVAAGVRKYMEIASRPPSCGPLDLNVSLAASLAQLEKTISANSAVIVSDSLPTVSADAVHMVTLFETLIGNSIKFRSPDVPPRIQVSSYRKGDIRTITIADNGIGIDAEYCETIFLPFKRLNGTEYPGAGLGLAAAKVIVEMHGGEIRIDPIADGAPTPYGTRVQFTLLAIEPE